MNANLDLKQTEKASYKLAAYADGTADISLGLVMILLGIYPTTRELLGVYWNFPLFLFALGLVVYAQFRVKKRITPSRIGIVEFGEKVKNRAKVALLITVVLFTLTVLTWVGAAQGFFNLLPDWLGSYGVEIIFAVVILSIFGSIAYTLEMTRFYLYGFMLSISLILQAFLDTYDGVQFLASGLIITVIGFFLMHRFLKQFPEQLAAADNGEV
jgi:hypothetical protein